MRAYVVTTGIVFVLIVAGHVARVATEGTRLLTEPSFLITSAIAVALALWAGCLFRGLARKPGDAKS